jgi:hypothetical protein
MWKKLSVLAIVILLAAAAVMVFGRGKPLGPEPRIDFPTTTLQKTEILEFLQGEFTIIKDVGSLPKPILNAFTEVGGTRPVMANPGQKFEVGDVIFDASVPRKRLLFAGVSGDKCFVHYEQGGLGHYYVLELFRFTPADTMKPLWKGYCGPVKDIQGLRSEIEADHCRP